MLATFVGTIALLLHALLGVVLRFFVRARPRAAIIGISDPHITGQSVERDIYVQ